VRAMTTLRNQFHTSQSATETLAAHPPETLQKHGSQQLSRVLGLLGTPSGSEICSLAELENRIQVRGGSTNSPEKGNLLPPLHLLLILFWNEMNYTFITFVVTK